MLFDVSARVIVPATMTKRPPKTTAPTREYRCCKRCGAPGVNHNTITKREEQPRPNVTVAYKVRYYCCADNRCGTTWQVDVIETEHIIGVRWVEAFARAVSGFVS
jgi:hypothetical protein